MKSIGSRVRGRYYRVRRFLRRLRDIKWWVLHRTLCRFHTVKTGLKPGYYDADTRLVEAMYFLLKEFVEVEKGGIEGVRNTIKWTEEEQANDQVFFTPDRAEELRKIWQSVESIYLWCTDGRPKMQAEMDLRNKDWYEVEQKMDAKDTEMLKLLVEVRGCLWT